MAAHPDVCIGIPVYIAPGYPPPHGAVPPFPRAAAPLPPLAATPPHHGADANEYISGRAEHICRVMVVLIAIVSTAALIGMAVIIHQNNNHPSFKLESVLVSLEQQNNSTSDDDYKVTANWDIGFSVRNSNRKDSVQFRDIRVWVQCTSVQGSTVGSTVAVLPALKQAHKNTTFLNVTVSSLLAPDRISPLMPCMEFDVTLGCRLKSEEMTARNMEVAWRGMRLELTSSNGTQGVMIGGSTAFQVSN